MSDRAYPAFFTGCLFLLSSCGTTDRECATVRTGTYQDEILPDTMAIYIRTDSFMLESVPIYGMVARYHIRWLDPCTYQLFGRSSVKGKPFRMWTSRDTVTVRILDVDADGLTYFAFSNFSSYHMNGRQVGVSDRSISGSAN